MMSLYKIGRHPRSQAAQFPVVCRLDFYQKPSCSVQPINLYTLVLGSGEYQHGGLSPDGSS